MFSNLKKLPLGLEPRDAFTRFAGGLDQETPSWSSAPGRARDSMNYEIAIEDGYRDVKGYERFSGRDKPSDASFTILDATITGAINVGDTITGATSGAFGEVIAKDTYPDDPAQTYLVLTKVSGVFDEANENLVNGGVQGNTDAIGYDNSAPTAKLTAQYKNLAADEYRADIAAVPGEGDVWGGFSLGADKYAIRNAIGGFYAQMYRATPAGWALVDLGYDLSFNSGGVTEIEEGNVITGATSGATATVTRIQVTSGTWAGGDATGFLTIANPVGNFVGENLNVGATLNIATISGSAGPIILQPNGRLDYAVSNFADPQGPERAYGADSVSHGWEFDGTVFAFIRTGMDDDTPDHVYVHKNQLFFSFDSSSQNSGIGDPMAWSVVLGADEIATDSPITGYQAQPGAEGDAALLIACRQRMYLLYGNDSDDWNLVPYRQKVGAYEWTLATLAYTLCLDDRGIIDFRTTQAFGNFDHSSLSNLIRTLLNEKRTLAVAACVVRDKNQYRLFMSDRTAIYVTMSGAKLKGMMPVTLGHQVTTVWSEEDPDGNEEVFFGCDNGFVYQMERGTSFDGDNIYGFLYTHFDHAKSIGWVKSYHAPVTVEAKGSGYAEFDLGYQLSYGRPETPQPNTQTAVMPAARTLGWDAGISWDTGLSWDGGSLVPTVGLDLRGEGENISWGIVKDSDYFEPLLLTGVHYHYLPRYRARG